MYYRFQRLTAGRIFRTLVTVSFTVTTIWLTVESARAGTVLGDLANQMQPGTWAELNTQGLNTGILDGVSPGYILQYTDNGTWDPGSRQFLFLGQDHNSNYDNDPSTVSKFIAYSEATNSWSMLATIPCLNVIHAYDHNAINQATGEFYHRRANETTIYRYNIKNMTWSSLPPIPSDLIPYVQIAGALEYFPEMGGLVFVNGGEQQNGAGGVYFFNTTTNQWSKLGSNLPMYNYHNFAEYSPILKVMIFGGGNNDRDIYRLDASGQITKMRDAPVDLGITQTIITVDPVSGMFLVFSDQLSVYEYNPITDVWTLLSIPTPPFFTAGPDGPIFGTIAAPISTYGVIMFVNYDFNNSKVYLYKHKLSVRPTAPSVLQVR
jgi:hypothetical protein